MSILANATIPENLLKNVVKSNNYNKIIINYYEKYLNEVDKDKQKTFKNKLDSIRSCNEFWNINKYEEHKIKEFLSTNLCKDKFCSNCKKVKQASRMSQYYDELSKYSEKSYLMTLTQPNVRGSDLKNQIKHMSKCYSKLNRYLSGNLKIKDIDFESWGYKGAIRSLEVTFKKDSYHPHYHILLVCDDLEVSDKHYINDYSYSYNKLSTKFSYYEIIIQKIWYLLINNEKVTKKNIDNLKLGYSCKIDKLEVGDYNEIFKYMTKEVDEDHNVLSYENFKVLYESLYRVKQIQGYGCLYSVKDDFDVSEVIAEYENYIEELKELETPEFIFERPQDLLANFNSYRLISKKKYINYLKNIED